MPPACEGFMEMSSPSAPVDSVQPRDPLFTQSLRDFSRLLKQGLRARMAQ